MKSGTFLTSKQSIGINLNLIFEVKQGMGRNLCAKYESNRATILAKLHEWREKQKKKQVGDIFYESCLIVSYDHFSRTGYRRFTGQHLHREKSKDYV